MKKKELEYNLDMFRHVPLGILITNHEGTILKTNTVFKTITGYNDEEILGKKIGKGDDGLLYSGFHDDKFYDKLWETILSGKAYSGLIKNKKKDGKLYWQHVTITPYVDPTQAILYVTYITDQTNVLETENFLARIINTVPGLTYVVDLGTKKNFFQSKNTRNILGYDWQDIQELPHIYKTLIHPDDLPRVMEVDENIKQFQNGETIDYEFRVLHADGSYRILRAKEAVFERDLDNTPTKKIGIALDATEEINRRVKFASLENNIATLLNTSREISQILKVSDA